MGRSDADDTLIYNSREAAEAYAAKKGMKIVEEHLDHLVVRTRAPTKTLRLAFYTIEKDE